MPPGSQSDDARPSDEAEAAGGAERSHPRDHRGEAVWPCQTNAEPQLRAVLSREMATRWGEPMNLWRLRCSSIKPDLPQNFVCDWE